MADGDSNSFFAHAWHARQLFGAVPLFAISTGALYPLIALELSSSGYGNVLIGAVTSAWYLGAFLGTVLGGRVINRFGYHYAFAFTATLAAFSVWGLNLSNSPVLWLFLRLVGGFGLGAYYLLMESWISGLATQDTRGRMLATYEAMRIGAVALGPLLLVVTSTHTAFALIGAIFVLAIIPITTARPPSVKLNPTNWRHALDIFACSPCTLTLTVIAGLLSSSFYGLGAIYAENLGFSKVEIAMFVSVILFAPALSQLPIGTLADFYGRARISVLVALLAAICAFMLALQVPSSFLAVTIVAAIVTGLSHPLYALGHGRLVDGGHELIAATTAGLIGYNIGTFLGPIGAALAMDHLNPAGLYFWVSLCLVFSIFAAMLTTLQPRARCCPL